MMSLMVTTARPDTSRRTARTANRASSKFRPPKSQTRMPGVTTIPARTAVPMT